MASWWASTGRETWLETKKQDAQNVAAPASRAEAAGAHSALPTMQSAEVCGSNCRELYARGTKAPRDRATLRWTAHASPLRMCVAQSCGRSLLYPLERNATFLLSDLTVLRANGYSGQPVRFLVPVRRLAQLIHY